MATFKLDIQSHHLKSDGTYNIKIRVIHNRQIKYISTPYFVAKADLTKKMELKDSDLIIRYQRVVKEYREAFDRFAAQADTMTADQVVERVKLELSRKEGFALDFIKYGREYAQTKGEGSKENYLIALNSLNRFNGGLPLDISAVTAHFLTQWANWIMTKNDGKEDQNGNPLPAKPVKGRAVSLYASYFRAIHNAAKREFNDEELGNILIKGSPFNKFKIPAPPTIKKRALSVEQVRKLIAYSPTTKREELARDMWLLSFCLAGANSADLYELDTQQGDVITYQRKKTRTRRSDKAEFQIRIEPQAIPLVNKYADASGGRLFTFYRLYANADTFNAAINKGLRSIGQKLGIDNELQFYSARHSWATIARNDCGVSEYVVHTALNHVDEKMRVTDIYLVKNWDAIWDANRQVIQAVLLPGTAGPWTALAD